MDKSLAHELNKQYTSIYYYLHYLHQDTITHQAVRLLQHIEMQTDVTIGDLAKLLSINHNTASEHVKRLINAGLVTKERSREDERKVLVRLTKKGEEVLHRNSELDQEKLATILQKLSDKEREIVTEAFSILAEEAKKCSLSQK